jgi:hypothetical protein
MIDRDSHYQSMVNVDMDRVNPFTNPACRLQRVLCRLSPETNLENLLVQLAAHKEWLYFAPGKKDTRMALVGFKNTHNQDIFINPAQVLYVTTFEEGVSIVALAIVSAGGKPFSVYVRGHVDQVRQKLDAGAHAKLGLATVPEKP